MNELSSPVKNIFSKAALAMLNACARFAYNLSQGFGIKFLRKGGSVAVGIDENALSSWIKSFTAILQENAIDPYTKDKPYDISDSEKLGNHAPTYIESDYFSLTDPDTVYEIEPSASRIIRIGRSGRAAREDHTHFIRTTKIVPQKDRKIDEGSSGHYVFDVEQNKFVANPDPAFALANHAHPLNIGDDGESYAAGNHRHDNDYAQKAYEGIMDNAADAASSALNIAREALQKAEEIESKSDSVLETAEELEKTVEELKEEAEKTQEEVAGYTSRIVALEEGALTEEDVSSAISAWSINEIIPQLSVKIEASALEPYAKTADIANEYATKDALAENIETLNDTINETCIPKDDINQEGGVQAYSKKFAALDLKLNSDGTVPLSAIKSDLSGHTNNCFVTLDAAGALSHSGNEMYNLLSAAANEGVEKLLTDADIDEEKFELINSLLDGVFGAGSTFDFTSAFTTAIADALNEFNKWGALKNPTSAQLGASNTGGDSTSFLPSVITKNTATWNRTNATNGLKVQMVTRTVRSNDCDYHFWRWASFDKNGALYEMSAEQGVYSSVNYEGYLGDI